MPPPPLPPRPGRVKYLDKLKIKLENVLKQIHKSKRENDASVMLLSELLAAREPIYSFAITDLLGGRPIGPVVMSVAARWVACLRRLRSCMPRAGGAGARGAGMEPGAGDGGGSRLGSGHGIYVGSWLRRWARHGAVEGISFPHTYSTNITANVPAGTDPCVAARAS